jgi:hypothetical protein
MITWQDRKHWEVGIGRFRVARWHRGAPCRWLAASVSHPIRAWKVRP